MYPVFIYQEGMELPQKGTYFVVAGNGTFMHKDTGICQCLVPVPNISFLDDLVVDNKIQVDLPKVPADLVWQIKEFFRAVVKKYHAESEVTLYYNPEKQHYKLHVPQQFVSHASVHYRRVGTIHLEEMEGYLRVGTIHSHCDFGAFHSGTDVDDESDFDGLHVTFGHNDKDAFTISASLVINNFRKIVDPLEYLEGIEKENGNFRLTPIPVEVAKNVVGEVEKWLQNVNQSEPLDDIFVPSHNTSGLFLRTPEFVEWADDMKEGRLPEVLGQGPFEIVSRSKGRLTIKTDSGEFYMPDTFFKEIKQ